MTYHGQHAPGSVLAQLSQDRQPQPEAFQMNPSRTIGPRGDVGVNRAFVAPALQALPLLIHMAEDGSPARFHRRGDGSLWFNDCRKMGGRKTANARRRSAQSGA